MTRRPCGHGARTASLGFFFSRASCFRAPAAGSRGSLDRRGTFRVSRTWWGEPLQVRCSGVLPVRPPRGVGTLAFISLGEWWDESPLLVRLLAGTAPGRVLEVGRARGWRVLSFRRFPPHGEERRTEGTGTRREEGSARREHDRSCPLRSRGTGSVRTIAGLLPGWGLPDIWFHRPVTRWARGLPRDGFKPERTRGPLQPEVRILSILVAPWERVFVEGDGDHPRFTRSFRVPPASPGSFVQGGSWWSCLGPGRT